jgi:hypothetical protein
MKNVKFKRLKRWWLKLHIDFVICLLANHFSILSIRCNSYNLSRLLFRFLLCWDQIKSTIKILIRGKSKDFKILLHKKELNIIPKIIQLSIIRNNRHNHCTCILLATTAEIHFHKVKIILNNQLKNQVIVILPQ